MTKTDWTADEVRAHANLVVLVRTKRMLTYLAERIEADESAVPVAEVGNCYSIDWIGSGPIAPIIKQHNIKIGDKLFTHPPAQPAQEQPGWKWVPVDPTDAMVDAWVAAEIPPIIGNDEAVNRAVCTADWKAMLAASPTPPKGN